MNGFQQYASDLSAPPESYNFHAQSHKQAGEKIGENCGLSDQGEKGRVMGTVVDLYFYLSRSNSGNQ